MSVARLIGRGRLRPLSHILQRATAMECGGAAACSSSAASLQGGSWRSAADTMSCRSFSSDAQPAEEPRVASGLNMVKGGMDPPLLPDGDYPSWLWQLGETRPPLSQLRRGKDDELTFEQQQRLLKLENRELIRDRNASKAKRQ